MVEANGKEVLGYGGTRTRGTVKEDETPARFVGVQVPGAEAERSGLIDMLL
ncbi:hypothetical protein OIU76_003322, partial [Salix suchowensis]